MAGDWIKMQTVTAQKPEVTRMAEMLGVDRRHMVGILFDFFVWIDVNARREVVRNMSRNSLDGIMNCPGFAASLETVGWVRWNDEAYELTIVNYERHNGESSKNRALDADRKRKQRLEMSGSKPDKSVTREEKRRVLKTSVSPFEITPEIRDLSAKLGVDCDAELMKFRDHGEAKGVKHKSEAAAFRNWLRNAQKYGIRDGTLPAKPLNGALKVSL